VLAQIRQVGRVLVPLAGPKGVSAPVPADRADDDAARNVSVLSVDAIPIS
jgi:hypothetical protein